MSPQKKLAETNRPVSVIETLEGRQLFAATGASEGALLPDTNVSSISITVKVSKSSPGFDAAKETPKPPPPPPIKIVLSDVLISNYQ